MPQKINMIISNNNTMPRLPQIPQINNANISKAPTPVARAPSQLNAPIISRIHSVRPGCGACGRH